VKWKPPAKVPAAFSFFIICPDRTSYGNFLFIFLFFLLAEDQDTDCSQGAGEASITPYTVLLNGSNYVPFTPAVNNYFSFFSPVKMP